MSFAQAENLSLEINKKYKQLIKEYHPEITGIRASREYYRFS